MKTILTLMLVLAVLVGVGVKFLVSPVLTAYGSCQSINAQKMTGIMMPTAPDEMADYCTSSRESLDDLGSCIDQVEMLNFIAPYLVAAKLDDAGSYNAIASTHMENCPKYPLGME